MKKLVYILLFVDLVLTTTSTVKPAWAALLVTYNYAIHNKTASPIYVKLNFTGGPACKSKGGELAPGDQETYTDRSCCLSQVIVKTKDSKGKYSQQVISEHFSGCKDRSFNIEGGPMLVPTPVKGKPGKFYKKLVPTPWDLIENNK